MDGTGHGDRAHDGVERKDPPPARRIAAPKQVVGREANEGEMENTTFWEALVRLVACHSAFINRSRGTVQPSEHGCSREVKMQRGADVRGVGYELELRELPRCSQ